MCGLIPNPPIDPTPPPNSHLSPLVTKGVSLLAKSMSLLQFFFFFFLFLGRRQWHMEGPRLGVEGERQLSA